MLLSIIVPAYNAEKYLTECLDSLINQNFNNDEYEILVVDDGSKDTTVAIAKDYSTKHPFIKLIECKKNKGVSTARNIGIEHSKGKYITFVDADDEVSKNLYPVIVNIMDKDNLTCFRFNRTHDKSRLIIYDGTYSTTEEKYIIMPVWAVVYKKELIAKNNILFKTNISYREDFLFNYEYLQSTNPYFTVAFKPVYFNRINTSSVTNGLFDNEVKLKKCYTSYLTVSSYIKNKKDYENFDEFLYNKAISQMICALVWLSIRGKIKPKIFLKDLKDNNLRLKDINQKIFEGVGSKYKFKKNIEYYSRYTFLYRLFYYSYRIINCIHPYKNKQQG